MTQQTRTLLAVISSVGILVLYSIFFAPKPPVSSPIPPAALQPAASGVSQPEPSVPQGDADRASPVFELPAMSDVPRELLPRKTAYAEFAWDSWGGELAAWRLSAYRKGLDKASPPIDLVRDAEALKQLAVGVSGVPFPETPHYRVVRADEREIVLAWESEVFALRATYTWEAEHPIVNVSVEAENRSSQAQTVALALAWEDRPGAAPGGFLSSLSQPLDVREPVGFWEGKRHVARKAGEGQDYRGKIYWSGIEERYFVVAMMPVDGEAETRLRRDVDRLSAQVAYPSDSLAPGEKRTHRFRAYLGPKKREALLASGNRLEETIDYGWFSAVAVPILFLLKAFYSVLHNWGLAIIALTVLIKLLLTPVTNKSMKSMKALQALQPELAKLREKYKDNRERLNLEMMQLFRTHKVNPMGGCLPMLLQMPIYIALYKVLYTAIELYHAPFFGFYKDLSAPDPYFIAPVLLGGLMVLQQKFTPATTMDPMQQKMMMIMPVVFTAFMLFLPSGLVLYIFVNTLLAVVQQWMMKNDLTWRELVTGKWRKEA